MFSSDPSTSHDLHFNVNSPYQLAWLGGTLAILVLFYIISSLSALAFYTVPGT